MKEGFGLPASARQFVISGDFHFEHGDVVPNLSLGYSTYGKLNEAGTNAVIVGHSLTSNSCVHEWWGPLIGEGPEYMLDTSKYFVICCNYLGSVYGSSGPLDTDSRTGQRFAADFPIATLRDNVRAQKLLLDALGVRRLAFSVGGSLGGMLAMEWACEYPDLVDRLIVVACVPQHSDWAIGWGEAGRQAIFADPRWRNGYYDTSDPPLSGMNVARQMAMLSYRTPYSFTNKFKRATLHSGRTAEQRLAQGQGVNRASQNTSLEGAPYYDVERYLNYQGEKFTRRFDPLAYVRLTQLLDSHDIGRGRGEDYKAVLQRMKQHALVVGIDSDLLYPLERQQEMARLIPDSSLFVIHTPHGHDGFLIEIDGLNAACSAWIRGDTAAQEQAGVISGAAVRKQWQDQQAAIGAADRPKEPLHPKRKIKLG